MKTKTPPAGASKTAPVALGINPDVAAEEVIKRIGAITRHLHDALAELGVNKNKNIENAMNSLPDARARLSYIAKLTGESAEKVLNTVEAARVTQEEMKEGANALHQRWRGHTAQTLAGPEGDALVTDTNEFLGSLSMSTDLANSYLTDIMMAQDFHDLTGQVIRKVVNVAQDLEEQLLAILMETTPADQIVRPAQIETDFIDGPAMNTENRTDVVTSQSQVDDMLASLGF